MNKDRTKIIVAFPSETGEMRRGFFSPKLAELFSLRHPGAYLIIGSNQEQKGGQNGGC